MKCAALLGQWLACLCLSAASGQGLALSGQTVYNAKCSLCHDGGAGNAPRISDPAAWRDRIAQGTSSLYRVALEGKPDTAMAARGGFAELSEQEVREAVDYMLTRIGLGRGPDEILANPRPALPSAAQPPGDADDATLRERLSQALAAIPGLRVRSVRIEIADGVVRLSGMLRNAEEIRATEQAAAAIGARRVESKLIPAALFQWD